MRLRHLSVMLCFFSACGSEPQPVDETIEEILNGDPIDTPEFKAVVSIRAPSGGTCSGTFIHPHFILTAAHCIEFCPPTGNGPGCVVAESDIAIIEGEFSGWNGPVSGYEACNGRQACSSSTNSGVHFDIDGVFFPASWSYNSEDTPPDVALLHTVQAFSGPLIEVMPASALPTPTNLCARHEGRTVTIAGFSRNEAERALGLRRIGDAQIECDIEMGERAYKLDGDTRSCRGDSGGPALTRDANNELITGGVISYSSLPRCPSGGETGIAFIPRDFIDDILPVLTVRKLGAASGSITAVPGGITCNGAGSDCSQGYDLGTSVTLTAATHLGSVFAGWSGACSGTQATCTLTIGHGPVNVDATFVTPTASLFVQVRPLGEGHSVRIDNTATCTSNCTYSRPYLSESTLEAIPAPGFELVEWTGACSFADETCTVTMNGSSQTAFARFCLIDDFCCAEPNHPLCEPECPNPANCPD